MSAPTPEVVLRRRLLARAPRLAAFDPADYLALNPDLANADAFDHFARFGAWEPRSYVTAERLTARLAVASVLSPPAVDEAGLAGGYRLASGLSAAIWLPPAGALAEPARARGWAERMAGLLEGVGAQARVVQAPFTPDALHAGERLVMVEPAALFAHARPVEAAAEALAQAVVLVAETPQAAAFGEALPYALAARGALCLEASACAAFAHAGLPAAWLGAPPRELAEAAVPPDHPLIAGLSRAVRQAPPGLPWTERPIDVAALEDATGPRTAAWERMADGMADFITVVRRPADAGAHLAHEAQMRRFVYARARFVLHLHAGSPCAPDAQAVAEAADAGAALLTEPSPAHPMLAPGVHLFAASARRLPERVEDLLSPARAGEAAAAAARLRTALARQFDPERMGLELVRVLAPGAACP